MCVMEFTLGKEAPNYPTRAIDKSRAILWSPLPSLPVRASTVAHELCPPQSVLASAVGKADCTVSNPVAPLLPMAAKFSPCRFSISIIHGCISSAVVGRWSRTNCGSELLHRSRSAPRSWVICTDAELACLAKCLSVKAPPTRAATGPISTTKEANRAWRMALESEHHRDAAEV